MYRIEQGDTLLAPCVRRGALHLVAAFRVRGWISRDEYLVGHPEDAAYFSFCDADALLVEELAPPDLERIVPPSVVLTIRFRSRKGVEPMDHVDANGRIARGTSLQAVIRRLDEACGPTLLALVS